MKKWNIGAAAVFFAISAFVFVSTAEYAHPIGANTIGQDPGSAIWPRCLAVLLAVLSIGMVIEGFVGKAYRNSNEAPINVKSPEMKGVYWMLLIFAAYCVVLRFGGFILASVIFIPSVMWVLGERKWLRAILVGVIATAAIYALFKFGLRVRLPQGVLFKL